MRVLVDADGCPVIRETILAAAVRQIPVILICDTAHDLSKYGVPVITVSKGADSADLALANEVRPGDLVVTQDYGLAALCLARWATPLNQDGVVFTEENIDAFLAARHLAKKLRNAGGRLKGPSKRTKEQNKVFLRQLAALMDTGREK